MVPYKAGASLNPRGRTIHSAAAPAPHLLGERGVMKIGLWGLPGVRKEAASQERAQNPQPLLGLCP